MADLTVTPALRVFIPGNYEDAFVYMGTLVGVTADQVVVSLNYDRLIEEAIPDESLSIIRTLLLQRNDWLTQEGAQRLLEDTWITRNLINRIGATQEWLAIPESFSTELDYNRVLGGGTLLDLAIYNQRVFAGTTHGLFQASLLTDTDSGEIEFSAPRKRTDARCLALNIRYGAVAASCGPDGLLMSFDEFDELQAKDTLALQAAPVSSSVRSSWLGYHLVNYDSPSHSEGLRSRYQQASTSQRNVVVTAVQKDPTLIAVEAIEAGADEVDFVYNAHSTFYRHERSGRYHLTRRQWSRGRLGQIESSYESHMDRPLSTHDAAFGFVAETYDQILALSDHGASILHDGEAISVRTFPHSKYYQNLVVVVSEDGIHIISPLRGAASTSFEKMAASSQ